VEFTYEPTTGRLQTRTTSADSLTYGYDPTTGNLTTLTGTAGQALAYAYDGALHTGATWSGTVAGAVGTDYDAFHGQPQFVGVRWSNRRNPLRRPGLRAIGPP
jgi:YD repeat-containing protein